MDDNPKDVVRIPLDRSDMYSAMFQSMVHTQAAVDALAIMFVRALAKDRDHAVELAKEFDREFKKLFKEYTSEIQLERSWADVILDKEE